MKIEDVMLTYGDVQEKMENVFRKYEQLGINNVVSSLKEEDGSEYFDKIFATLKAKNNTDKMVFRNPFALLSKTFPMSNAISIGKDYPYKEEFMKEITPIYKLLASMQTFELRRRGKQIGMFWISEEGGMTTLGVIPEDSCAIKSVKAYLRS